MGATLGTIGRRALRALGGALPRARGGVTVLAYHLVGGGTDCPVDLPLDVFRRQLDRLAEDGRVLPLERALELLERGEDDRHRVVLTFDDAFRNFFEVAWPELAARRLPFTLYVPCGFVDGSSAAPLRGAEALPAMSWDEVVEVAQSEIGTLGSHTLTHPDLRRLGDAELRIELDGSRRLLERRCGAAPTSFCYPRALSSARVARRVAELYDSAVAAGGRRNRSASYDRHRLSRLPVRADGPAEIDTLLGAELWLEEWAAAHARRLAS